LTLNFSGKYWFRKAYCAGNPTFILHKRARWFTYSKVLCLPLL